MITRSDWNAVRESMMEKDRRTLGAPPTAAEMIAYLNGELPAEEAERIRELLVAYPELAQALTAPFPEEDAKPGDPDYLSDEEVEKRWAAVRASIQGAGTPRVATIHPMRLWRAVAALAAMLALAFGVISARMAWQMGQPRVLDEEQWLAADAGTRGGHEPEVIPFHGKDLLLAVTLGDATPYPEYRLELVDAGSKPPRVLWRSNTVQPSIHDVFSLVVPRKWIKPGGSYKLNLYGVDGTREERLLRMHSFRIVRPTSSRSSPS